MPYELVESCESRMGYQMNGPKTDDLLSTRRSGFYMHTFPHGERNMFLVVPWAHVVAFSDGVQ